MTSAPNNANPDEVQGDILVGVPKKVEIYYFFRIDEARVNDFRKHLGHFIPLVTTTSELIKTRKDIKERKGRGGGLLKVHGISIGFSHMGLQVLGLKDAIDPAFDAGMLAGAKELGDSGKQGNTGFEPDWDPAFKQGVHGLITIAGDSDNTVNEQLAKIEHIFCVHSHQASIHKALCLFGKVRPGKEEGHEHFGFNDGLSQPAVDVDDKQVTPLPGQKRIRQGIILLGRDGDDPEENTTRPAWALDGSFLAFRYQPQLVPEFDGFLKANPLPIPGLTPEQGSELLGARFVGRWKSGAPIDLVPTADDTKLADDPQRNNDFDFTFPDDPGTQTRCPFAAHIRKTNPRNDLEPGISTEKNRILRRGIQFGDEVCEEERKEGKTIKERGLFFACYQSNIGKGFKFIQESWANNPNFPPFKPEDQTPGLDPIIGQTSDESSRTMSGTNSADPTKQLALQQWVLSKGGEYFFAPSIPALKNTFAAAEGGKKEL